MKTQYYTATSLDGFIATEDDSLDWLFPLGDVNTTSYPDFIKEVGALAMGSSTYAWMLRHVIKPGDPAGEPCREPASRSDSALHTPPSRGRWRPPGRA